MNNPHLVDIPPEALRMWVPVDVHIAGDRPAIEWMDLQGVEFKEPFFAETLNRVDSGEERGRVLTEVDMLLQFEKICAGLSPAGFIFHCSRCGSTLVANACRALRGSVVIAEAPVIDKLITRLFTDAPEGSAKEMLYLLLLRAAVCALGQRLKGDECRYFVKLACTSTLQMRRLRDIWPDVPFLFLYRNPVEVIVSNLKSKPEWMKPESNPATAAAIVGIDEDQLASLSAEEYCARCLGKFFSEAYANLDGQMKLLNYAELSAESLVEIVKFFGVDPTQSEVEVIKKVSRFYSKDPANTRAFEGDSAIKRSEASHYVCLMADTWAQAAYNRLDTRLMVRQ